jgi:hypothetical protein
MHLVRIYNSIKYTLNCFNDYLDIYLVYTKLLMQLFETISSLY